VTTYDYVEKRFPVITRPDGVRHRLVPEPHCVFCSVPVKPEYAGEMCYTCGMSEAAEIVLSRLEGLIAATLYIPEVTGYPHTQEILDLKTSGAHADDYAWVITEVIRRKHLNWAPDCILTVPSGELGRPRDGTAKFAQAVARRLGAEFIGGLQFIRTVRSQHRMANRAERFRNIANSMAMEGELGNRSILIVDDVSTSLASMLEATRAVAAVGRGSVTAAVAGRVSRLETLVSLGVLKSHG
jgi:predicted amidophosphoribosyltransferase